MRAAAIVSIALLAASLAVPAPPAAAKDGGVSQAWMTRGFTLTLQTTPSVRAAADGAAAAPAPIVAVVSSVTSSNIEFRWMVGNVVEVMTFDRASRLGPGGASVLWVDADDIAAGRAQIGRHGAVLVLSTPAFHQFVSGPQNYYFSAATGLLIRAEDWGSGSALVTVAHGFSEPPPLLPTGAPGPATHRQYVPVAADYGMPLPTNELSHTCSGVVSDILGGTGACDPQHHYAYASYEATLTVEIPLLAQGSVRATFEDGDGPFLIVDCSAYLPAIYNLPPLPNNVLCKGTLLRPSLPMSQSVRMDAHFSHCLSPGYGFSCPWQGNLVLRGGVTT